MYISIPIIPRVCAHSYVSNRCATLTSQSEFSLHVTTFRQLEGLNYLETLWLKYFLLGQDSDMILFLWCRHNIATYH